MWNSSPRLVWFAWWWHFLFLHKEYLDWRLWCIVPYHQWWYWLVWHHRHWLVDSRKLQYFACYEEGQAACQGSPIWWDWMGSHSTTHEVLPKGRPDLFSFTCKLLQENRISCDHNNIGLNTMCDDIILDHQIKAHDGRVMGVKFLCKSNNERAQSATAPSKKNIINLYDELRHPSKMITQATATALSIQVTGMFKPCEDCTLDKAKQCAVSKKAAPCSKIGRSSFSLI